MSAAEESTPSDGEICIDASQLRPGVHVRLPVSWIGHQFMFSSFVITDEKQVRLIAAMKLPQLFCDPARCRVPPLPKEQAVATPESESDAEEKRRAAVVEAAHADAKRQRTRVMDAFRAQLNKGERRYRSAARTVGNAIANFGTSPQQSVKELVQVCEISAAALLDDPDNAFMLIAEQGHGDVHAAHALSVMTLSLLLGKQAGLPEIALRTIGTGALLHDIGKRLIKPSILRNSERNRHEEAIFQTHCRSGHDEASQSSDLSKPILETILYHHERHDGSGYPEHIAGSAIPLSARIVAIADRFDTLVNTLDPRQAISPCEALSMLWAREQKGFDNALLQLFIRAMGVYPPGSIVRLSDGRVAAVVGSAPLGKPLCPKVIVYAPEVPYREAMIADLATQDVVTIECMLGLQDRPADELAYLLPHGRFTWVCPGK